MEAKRTFVPRADCVSCRAQSARFGTQIFSETVTKVDLSRRPFKIWTDEKEVDASTLIIATGGDHQSTRGLDCSAMQVQA